MYHSIDIKLGYNREKEARKKEKEKREAQRMERMKQREIRGLRVRHVSDVEEEAARPPVPLVF